MNLNFNSYSTKKKKKKIGRVFSLKRGSFKFVIAGTLEAVKEVLVTRSADYSGRPQTYYFRKMTLGKWT